MLVLRQFGSVILRTTTETWTRRFQVKTRELRRPAEICSMRNISVNQMRQNSLHGPVSFKDVVQH